MFGGNDRKINYILILAGLICFAAAAVLLHSFRGQFGRDTATSSAVPAMTDTITVTHGGGVSDTQSSADSNASQGRNAVQYWVVYVTGAVKKPGVYKIPSGSRVYQALEAAGGFSANADQEAVNLAAMLEDGSHIRFPAKGEKGTGQSSGVPAKEIRNVSDIQGKVPAVSNLVNINTAPQEDLETLSGIGPKTALAIIAYRDANGAFKRIEDLLLIKGIGAKKYDAIRNMVTVGS